MKLMQFNGLSGLVRFDSQGVRTDFDLDVMELQVNDFQKGFFFHFIRQFQRIGCEGFVSAHKHTICGSKKTSKNVCEVCLCGPF